MIRISGIKLYLDYKNHVLVNIAAKKLGIKQEDIKQVQFFRRSVDARKKEDVHFIATLDITLAPGVDEDAILRKCQSNTVTLAPSFMYSAPSPKHPPVNPVVVGAGPAGLFAALILAQAGANPIVIERGKHVDQRQKDIESFWQTGKLNVNSNVQFGEGGAGTFSDGKLNTGTKDVRARKVLLEFVNAGAPREILYNAKPHIGTDLLPNVIKSIRKEILSLGGKFLFETTVTGLSTKDNALKGIELTDKNGTRTLETPHVIFAIGHSARDTFELLKEKKVPMEQKAFSIGARIEHLQSSIDFAQYGKSAGRGKLGAADYKLAVHLPNGRGVYTFCMCPGGTVVAAASEEGLLCTNGMSTFARDKKNANSALLVSVTPKDFKSEDVLAGIALQRDIERKAFLAGGGNYKAPVQKVDDFLKKRRTTSLGTVLPSYTAGHTYSDLHSCLPPFITDAMKQGILQMDNRLKGFANGNAVLTGVETRSSSPVRILRNEQFESVSVRGLYPCGEGAGYAGGIVSAAVDGIKCAEALLTAYSG